MLKSQFKCVCVLFLLTRFLPLLDLGLLVLVSNLPTRGNKMFSPPAEIAAADDLRSDVGKVLVEWKNDKDVLIGRMRRVCVKYRSTTSNLKAEIELKLHAAHKDGAATGFSFQNLSLPQLAETDVRLSVYNSCLVGKMCMCR